MYFAFVDDSGSARPYRAGARGGGSVHILSALIVHERDLCGARDAIDRAKRDLFAESDPWSWEMHAYNVWNNKGDFSGEDRSLNLERKKDVFSRSVEGIADSGATLVNVVVWKSRLPGGLTGPRIRALSWRLLVERFEAYLAARGGGDLGMIVSDASNRATEAEITEALRDPDARIGRHKSRRSLVLEDVIFKDSRSEPLLQAADIVAYILQKHAEATRRLQSGSMPWAQACGNRATTSTGSASRTTLIQDSGAAVALRCAMPPPLGSARSQSLAATQMRPI